MKTIKNIKKGTLVAILPLLLILFVVSCGNDDDATGGNFDIVQLQAKITEAENLIATGIEGTMAGDYQPGSKETLQSIVNWIYGRIDSSKSQENINDAVVKLNAGIGEFLVSTVENAMPWIQQENDTWIAISDDIKPTLNGAFTIETQVYAADLNQKGFSNNLFSAEQPGPDSGFGVRYFGDGNIQVVAGDGSGWKDTSTGPGVMKGGEWVDVAYTNSGTDQKLYINGSLVAEQTHGHLQAADVSFVIGNSPTWTDRVCNAVVREFKIWNSVLDEATIQSNIGTIAQGNESGLECYFPFGANLGNSFTDVTGNHTATIQGKVDWVTELPIIIKEFAALETAIAVLKTYRDNDVSEGDQDGDHPVGTLDFINNLLTDAEALLTSNPGQSQIDETTENLSSVIDYMNNNLVADTNGVTKPEDTPEEDFFRITPAYTPSGDYTIEFEMQFGSFLGFAETEIYNNNHYKMLVTGVEDPTSEDSFFMSGQLKGQSYAGDAPLGEWQSVDSAPVTVVPSDDWYHIALVYDATADVARLYVNQIMVAEQSSGFGLPNGWAAPEIDFFRGGDLLGSVKDIRYWDTARSAGELDADIAGTEAGLRMYFPLDRVAGLQVMDVTGVYTGTLKGGVNWNVD